MKEMTLEEKDFVLQILTSGKPLGSLVEEGYMFNGEYCRAIKFVDSKGKRHCFVAMSGDSIIPNMDEYLSRCKLLREKCKKSQEDV